MLFFTSIRQVVSGDFFQENSARGSQDYHWKKKTHAVKAPRIMKSYSVSVPQKVLQKTQTG